MACLDDIACGPILGHIANAIRVRTALFFAFPGTTVSLDFSRFPRVVVVGVGANTFAAWVEAPPIADHFICLEFADA